MSHFTVLVIGEDAEEQLAKYNENLEVERYDKGEVEEKYKTHFIEYYTEYNEETINHKSNFTPEIAAINKTLSFDELYTKYGEDWNDNDWEKNEDGIWHEFSTSNPNSRWDWYSIGGRWSGYLKLKPGRTGEKGTSGVFGNEVGYDIVTMGDVDWDGMRAEGEKKALEYFEKVATAFGGVIPQPEVTWSELWENEKYKEWDTVRKRIFYRGQDAIIKLESLKKQHNFLDNFDFSLEDFAIGKDKYVKQAGDNAVSFYAIVKDGVWHERGKMGWWAISYNEKSHDEWAEEVKSIFKDLPDETPLTLVDCHI